MVDPWDWPAIHRAFMVDEAREKGESVLTEADNLHRRFLFCMGVALAVFLLAVESLFRLILLLLGRTLRESVFTSWDNTLPPINHIWLVAITIFGLWASFELRQIAIRMWELETYLTVSLVRPIEDNVKTRD
ncbi:MAG: hypothetical protein CML07_08200 [Psychrobacter sp.]|nr:hypothetical protein [Psychrobacter sp.]